MARYTLDDDDEATAMDWQATDCSDDVASEEMRIECREGEGLDDDEEEEYYHMRSYDQSRNHSFLLENKRSETMVIIIDGGKQSS